MQEKCFISNVPLLGLLLLVLSNILMNFSKIGIAFFFLTILEGLIINTVD